MKIAIIIATHLRSALLERLLRDLSQNALAADTEVLVVENGARGGAREVCEQNNLGGRLRYFYLPEGRKAVALNRAVQNTAADLLIFFDDDISVPPDIVRTYREAASRRGPGYFFGGPLIAEIEVPCPEELEAYLPLSAIGWRPGNEERVMDGPDFDYFFGANWAVFRRDLVRSGLFAEELGITAAPFSPLGEENEIQERLVAAGIKPVYVPGAVIRHHVPRECYTARWVWRRRFRLGVTEWARTERAEQAHCRSLFGVPAWLFRAVAQQKVRAAVSRAMRTRHHTDIRMREAYLSGLLYAAWTTRKDSKQPQMGG